MQCWCFIVGDSQQETAFMKYFMGKIKPNDEKLSVSCSFPYACPYYIQMSKNLNT